MKQLLDRQSYDQQEVNQQSITEAVQKECDILNKCVKSSNGKLVAYSINTNEYEDSRDWKLTVDYIKSSGEPIQLLSILCFYTKGNVREGDVRYAKECYGDTIRKSMGIE